jgi:hypothetical protein
VGVCKTGSPTMRMGTTAMTGKLKPDRIRSELQSTCAAGNLS